MLDQAGLRTAALCLIGCMATLLVACGGGAGDSTPQTMTLSVTAATPSEASLNWTAHPDSVSGYDVFRNGSALFSTHLSGTSVYDYGLEPGTRYCYIVYAVVWPLGYVGRSNEACVTTASGTSGWRIETIATGRNAGLSLNSSNQPQISYRNSAGVHLAYKSAGTWLHSMVDALASSTGDTDVAVDFSSAVRLAYIDDSNDRLMHATNLAGPWATDIADTAVGLHAALAIDSAGNAHIAYDSIEPTTPGVASYATNASGSWVVTRLVGFSNASIADTDIAVDGSGYAHIALATQGVGCYVYYFTNQSGSWVEQIVASDCNGGVSLAIDSGGYMHIAYSAPLGLMHATNRSGSWQSEQLDSYSWIGGKGVGLALDAANRLHIAYQDNNQDLKYATNVGGTWRRYYIESSGDVGYYPSISVDTAGRVRIAYADNSNGTLKLATSP